MPANAVMTSFTIRTLLGAAAAIVNLPSRSPCGPLYR
jgi:hypothetical protein